MSTLENLTVQPKDTSKGHFYVSLVKSALRIIAGGNLVIGNLFWAGTFLILAELLGILEELV
jgi:predicted ATP-dependent Lon-type protease